MSEGESSKSADRIDQLVAAQKDTINDVFKFVGNVAELTSKGNFSPDAWVKEYRTLLVSLSDDMAKAAKALLKD